MQRTSLLFALAASILLASAGAGRCGEPVRRAKTVAATPATDKKQKDATANNQQRLTAREKNQERADSHDDYVYRTPTGSHIPQRYTVHGRDADTNQPLTVVDRNDLDNLDIQGRDLSGALSRFPYIQTTGR